MAHECNDQTKDENMFIVFWNSLWFKEELKILSIVPWLSGETSGWHEKHVL